MYVSVVVGEIWLPYRRIKSYLGAVKSHVFVCTFSTQLIPERTSASIVQPYFIWIQGNFIVSFRSNGFSEIFIV